MTVSLPFAYQKPLRLTISKVSKHRRVTRISFPEQGLPSHSHGANVRIFQEKSHRCKLWAMKIGSITIQLKECKGFIIRNSWKSNSKKSCLPQFHNPRQIRLKMPWGKRSSTLFELVNQDSLKVSEWPKTLFLSSCSATKSLTSYQTIVGTDWLLQTTSRRVS